MERLAVALSGLRRTLPAFVAAGILVLLVGATGRVPAPGGALLVGQPWSWVIAGIGVLCVSVSLALVVVDQRRDVQGPAAAILAIVGQPLGISAYVRSRTPEFYVAFEKLVGTAKQVKLVSMGLQILREGNILDVLVERARNGDVEVIACMSNPYNPDVIDRLTEEEMSDTQPQIGRHGIERNIRSLLDHLDKENNPSSFRVYLFEHYPTLATYIVDQDVFVAPYTYRRLGWDAPLLHMRNDGNSVARFFVDNADRMLRDAVPANDVFGSHPDRRHFSEQWLQACVSIVPDANEPVYQLGSSIVGFDVRGGALRQSSMIDVPDLPDSIGEAAELGFHAPLADPLYFVNEAAIRRVAAEMTLLAEEFPGFTLVNPRVEDRSHVQGGIVLRWDDSSGVAEALHGELVSRVYRRAISSAYRGGGGLRPPSTSPASSRSNLMIRRYGSPYVLGRWDLRFTLCSAPPADPASRNALVERLDDAFQKRLPAAAVDVDRIYLLVRTRHDARWRIRNAYRLDRG